MNLGVELNAAEAPAVAVSKDAAGTAPGLIRHASLARVRVLN